MPMIGRRIYPGMKRAAWGFMQSGDFPVPVCHLKFGENKGNVLKDSSPYGNDAENHGATWTKGWLGPGLSFDGLDDYVVIPHSESLDVSYVTVLARVYPYYTGDRRRIVYKSGTGVGTSYDLEIWGTNFLHNSYYTEAGWKGEYFYSIPEFEVWYLPGFTYDGKYIRSYLNGTPVGTPTALVDTLKASTSDVGIGSTAAGIAQWFKGIIDEVLIFDEALNARQMRQWALGYR